MKKFVILILICFPFLLSAQYDAGAQAMRAHQQAVRMHQQMMQQQQLMWHQQQMMRQKIQTTHDRASLGKDIDKNVNKLNKWNKQAEAFQKLFEKQKAKAEKKLANTSNPRKKEKLRKALNDIEANIQKQKDYIAENDALIKEFTAIQNESKDD